MALLRPITLIVVLAYLFVFADALPSQNNHPLRVSACSNKLNKFGLVTAKKFCIPYLNGRKPASPSKVIVKTYTTTLDPKTTTIPLFATLTDKTTSTQTTTSTLTTITGTTQLVTATVTPTETDSVTATETITTTVTDTGGQRRKRATVIDADHLNPQPLLNNDKRSSSAFTSVIGSLNSFASSEITDACLLLVYGRTSDSTKTITSSSTTTSTPTQKTTQVTQTVTTTKTETEVLTDIETQYTSTSTDTITTTEQAPVESTTVTIATITQTSTTTVQPSPTTTTGIVKVDFDSGAQSKYLFTRSDSIANSYLLGFTSDVNSASTITFDNTNNLLLLASDTSYHSSTVGKTSNYYFRLTRDGTLTSQAAITCSLQPSTKQLACSTAESYSILQSCGGYLTISSSNTCGTVSLSLI